VPRSSRLPLVLRLREQLGLDGLAEVEAHLVRTRAPPARLVARLARGEPSALSPREREVLVLLASGLSKHEIADELHIGYETVRQHTARAYAKLGAHSVVQAVNAFLDEQA